MSQASMLLSETGKRVDNPLLLKAVVVSAWENLRSMAQLPIAVHPPSAKVPRKANAKLRVSACLFSLFSFLEMDSGRGEPASRVSLSLREK